MGIQESGNHVLAALWLFCGCCRQLCLTLVGRVVDCLLPGHGAVFRPDPRLGPSLLGSAGRQRKSRWIGSFIDRWSHRVVAWLLLTICACFGLHSASSSCALCFFARLGSLACPALHSLCLHALLVLHALVALYLIACMQVGAHKVRLTREFEATQPAFDRHIDKLMTAYGEQVGRLAEPSML